jgi:ACS family pantothenate transporter-like MFS transporter
VKALLTSFQKGMWAMIGTSIALVIWTSGLLYMANNAEKKRATEAQVGVGDEQKNFEVDATGDAKV